jgi:poly-gamma-glutamate capsule biosynthesis protein CapA/YwtB (metallophosphatase superfamily)
MTAASPVPAADLASIVAVGDMMFDTRLRPPRVFFHKPEIATCKPDFESLFAVPFVNGEESRRWLARRGISTFGIDLTSHAYQSKPLDVPEAEPGYPFRAVLPELRAADLVFGNLECPLSTRGRPMSNDQCYCASPDFGAALADASFRVVSFANNHCMDYGDAAFLDTLDVLEENGIAVVGAGRTLRAARRPAIFDLRGVRVAFLGYTMVGPERAFAVDGECGAVPLNPLLVAQDITSIRLDVDLVILSVHWGGEMVARPQTRLVDFAHELIDAGADAILGHHPHVPGSVEIYRGRPIVYSLGNFCFGHDHGYWADNMIVKLTVDASGVHSLELTPIGGGDGGRYQPYVLRNGASGDFRRHLALLSEPFGARVEAGGEGRCVIDVTRARS